MPRTSDQRSRFVVVVVAVVGVVAGAIACARDAAQNPHAVVDAGVAVEAGAVDAGVDDHDDVVFGLEELERGLRPAVMARVLAGRRADHGADPIALAVRADGVPGVVLQGRDQLAVLDDEHDAFVPTDPWPTSLTVDAGDFVVGSLVTGRLQRVDQQGRVTYENVDGVDGVSALAAHDSLGRGVVEVGDVDGNLVSVQQGRVVGRCVIGPGLTRLVALERHVIALSSLGHSVHVLPLDAHGVPACDRARVERFTGALWNVDGYEDEAGDVVVVVAGVEDHDLDRSGGFFGHIDSFLYGLRFGTDGRQARVWERNLSELGVVNGVALELVRPRGGTERLITVFGKGNGGHALIDTTDGDVRGAQPGGVPGIVAAVDGVRINVLTDSVDVPHPHAGRSRAFAAGGARERLGEQLVFTTSLAPQQTSDGAHSRFTCETCHPGGGVDGRVHKTGRDDDGHAVTATTKPLFGLFQNPPLFTRGLDRSVGVMVHAEFKVANAGTPQHPWFDASTGLAAAELRAAMVAYFASLSPPPNPRASARLRDGGVLDDDEARGWAVFQQRCLSCHAPRVFADDAASVPDDVVTALLRGALVFGRDGYEDTGVRPKVHPQGARPSSLRGAWKKTPLLTNGRAAGLVELLEQVRLVDVDGAARLIHEGAAGTPLSSSERRDLLSFLRLL